MLLLSLLFSVKEGHYFKFKIKLKIEVAIRICVNFNTNTCHFQLVCCVLRRIACCCLVLFLAPSVVLVMGALMVLPLAATAWRLLCGACEGKFDAVE
jgi:hypothetical protein